MHCRTEDIGLQFAMRGSEVEGVQTSTTSESSVELFEDINFGSIRNSSKCTSDVAS